MSEKRIKLASSRLWSVYGPVIAQVCSAFSFDLVNLICAFVYPQPLPGELLDHLKRSTNHIRVLLEHDAFRFDVHQTCCIRHAIGSSMRIWILDTNHTLADWNRRFLWGKKKTDDRYKFWESQVNFLEKYGYDNTFQQEWKRRNEQFHKWRNGESKEIRLSV